MTASSANNDADRPIEQIVAEVCAAHFGGAAGPEHILRPPTGRFNETRFFVLDGRELVFRMAPPDDAGFLFYETHMMAQEPGLHALLREKTTVPVAEILVWDDSRSVAPRPFLVMEKLPGRPSSGAGNVFSQVGALLRQVHDLHADTYGYLGEHHPMEPQPTWAKAFAVMWNKLLDDCVACGGYGEEEADRLRSLQQRDAAVFDRDVPASLLHMDIWHENILVDEHGQVTGLVDWDRALWGDPEIEFAVLDYCGVSTPAFWQGYGRERGTSREARLRQVYYYLYELQKYIVIRTLRGVDRRTGRRYADEALRLAARLERG